MPWPYPRLIAHRAGGTVAPENTLAGVRLASSLGYRAVEVDVRLTSDDVVVLQHDPALDRNTNGSGLVAEHAWDALSRLDAGLWRGEAWRGEPLARLDAAAALMQSLGVVPHVEIKRIPGHEREFGERAAGEVAALWRGAPVPPLLISFSADALAGARASHPSLPCGFLVEAPWDGELGTLDRLGAVSLHVHHSLIDPDLPRRVHEQGRHLVAWTVNDVARADVLLAQGVDGIVTDNVREFAARFPLLLA